MRLALTICACIMMLSIAVFFASATVASANLAVLCSESTAMVREIRAGISGPLAEMDAASGNLASVTGQLRELLERPQVKRSLVLLAQSGDDLGRIFKRVNVILDTLNDSIKNTDSNLNGPAGVLPAAQASLARSEAISRETVSAIAEVRSLTQAAQADIHSVAGSLAEALAGIRRGADAATAAIEQMRLIAAGPMTESMGSMARATESAAVALENARVWTERLRRSRAWIWDALVAGAKWFKP